MPQTLYEMILATCGSSIVSTLISSVMKYIVHNTFHSTAEVLQCLFEPWKGDSMQMDNNKWVELPSLKIKRYLSSLLFFIHFSFTFIDMFPGKSNF